MSLFSSHVHLRWLSLRDVDPAVKKIWEKTEKTDLKSNMSRIFTTKTVDEWPAQQFDGVYQRENI